jgi:uncharacterized protein YfaT (DUF1175 family)
MMKEATSRGIIKVIFFSRGIRQHTSFQYVDDIVKYVKGEEGNLWTIVQLLNHLFFNNVDWIPIGTNPWPIGATRKKY